MRQISFSKERAFTLVELLIVIAIIAVLTVAFLPGALKAPAKARDAGRVKTVNDIAGAVESYASEHLGKVPLGATPFCLDDVATLVSFFNVAPKDPNPVGNGGLGSCNVVGGAKKTSYYYKSFDSENKYIVGALLEVAAGGNTDAAVGELTNAAVTIAQYNVTLAKTLTSGGGTSATLATPTGYFLRMGPN